ncbi:hypothetical protein C8R45DRAFT_1078542 [Mycena sanguinolenta]|nr:hypothetical protein C8R45DRAFT_1078542 [Mycena sanguinolenta]
MPSITRHIRSNLTSDAFADESGSPQMLSTERNTSAGRDDRGEPATRDRLHKWQPDAKSQRIKSNKAECEHLAERAAKIVQDIWRQTKDFSDKLSAEVERSVAEIETLFQKIENFFNGHEKEKLWQRLAHQDRHKSQVEEYGRLLDEALWAFSMAVQMHIYSTPHFFGDFRCSAT